MIAKGGGLKIKIKRREVKEGSEGGTGGSGDQKEANITMMVY